MIKLHVKTFRKIGYINVFLHIPIGRQKIQ